MKRHLYLMIDTETAGNLDNPIVYDLGLAVVDRLGEVYETHSLVIKEIWENLELLKTAYYSEKLPNYLKQLLLNERELVTFKQAQYIVNGLCEKYNIKAIVAHNAIFDYKALKNTQRFINNEYYFLPQDIEIWDTLKMARSVITTKKSYQKFCHEHSFLTKHKNPRPQASAEVLYRYISQNPSFIESHTGLEDCMIEKDILAYCFKQKKKMQKKLF